MSKYRKYQSISIWYCQSSTIFVSHPTFRDKKGLYFSYVFVTDIEITDNTDHQGYSKILQLFQLHFDET